MPVLPEVERPPLKFHIKKKPGAKAWTGLPKGWTVKTRTRESGASRGHTDTYYLSPSGKRCRSMAEVHQNIY